MFIICRLFDDAILTSVRWYLIAVLIFTSPIISDIEHFSMHLLAIYITLLEKWLFRLSVHYLIWGGGEEEESYSSVSAICIFWISIPFWSHHLKIVSFIL